MLERLELYFTDLINGKKKGIIPFFLKGVLRVFSWFYMVAVFFRNWLYDRGWLRRYSPPVPVVISIGNIVAGGTGKTPVTLLLAQAFYDFAPLAILSRGYRSKAENLCAPMVLSRGQGPMHPASFCGDEPYMLAQNLPKAFIFVGRDRHKASNMAAKSGAQLILLDDGMQHRHLARDFEVVVMDALDPFGRDAYLPRGFLREGLKSLSRADLIVLNHVYDHKKFLEVSQKIANYTTAPVVGTRTTVEQILDLNGLPIPSLEGKKVGIFCGIAHPDYFENTVKGLQAQVVKSFVVADHMEYDTDALQLFAEKCAEEGADCMICTEKDRVKLVESLTLPLPVYWVKMGLKFVEGEAQWQSFVERVKGDLARRL